MIENVGGYNILITHDRGGKIPLKLLYKTHIWIHNNVIKKNRTFLNLKIGDIATDERIQSIEIVLNNITTNLDWQTRENFYKTLENIKQEIGL
jgi:hypothetical protein